MELIIEESETIKVVTFPDSNLDASNNKDFVQAMDPMLDQKVQIVFDMSRLRFVDSSGLGSIMLCLRRLTASGGTLKLCGLSKSVHSLFELVRMHKVFEIYKTKDEAIQAFQT